MQHRRRARRSRGLIAFLVTLAVLGTIAVVADGAIRAEAERRAAERVTAEINARSEVRISGTLAGLRLLTGRIPRAEITAVDVPVDRAPVTIDQVDVVLTGVQFDVQHLRGGRELPAMDDARFEARIDAATVRELVDAPFDIAGLELVHGGVALRVPFGQVETSVRPVDGQVELVPDVALLDRFGARLLIDLSDQVGGPYVEEVRTDPSAMVVRGHLAAVPQLS